MGRTLVDQAAERWEACENAEHPSLLRLAVLRDLIRAVHADKSRALAQGNKEDSEQLRVIYRQVDELRAMGPLSGNLLDILSGHQKLRKQTRVLPQGLFTSLEREKLERYDRTWEAQIAAEAASAGWRFWSLDAWVKVAKAEDWHRMLESQLWPHGLLLFTESVPNGPEAPPELWNGRWILVLKGSIPHPRELNLQLEQFPGASIQPSPPQWKLIFSPRER